MILILNPLFKLWNVPGKIKKGKSNPLWIYGKSAIIDINQ